jgi:hypothetical protein
MDLIPTPTLPLEEASAATMEFSTAVPTNAAVAGIHWAGSAMSGSGGIVTSCGA